jgi:hypothetical protein
MFDRDRLEDLFDLQRRSYVLLRWISAKVQGGTLPLTDLDWLEALAAEAGAPLFREELGAFLRRPGPRAAAGPGRICAGAGPPRLLSGPGSAGPGAVA